MATEPQQRSDQMAYRLYAKLVLVVDDARNASTEPREDGKTDKWVSAYLCLTLTAFAAISEPVVAPY